MTTFVLVHGAGHGAWCWEMLTRELGARGQEAVVMDLPVSDPKATFEDYASVVVESAADAPDDVVVVGHSLGAMTIPLVAVRRPVGLLVSLCGVIPNFHGLPWEDAPADPDHVDPIEMHEDGSWTLPTVDAAISMFYGHCTREDAQWAFERLRPQNSASLWDRPYPLTQWPETSRAALGCVDDHTVSIEYSRYVAQNRLGVELIELPGDHSPFLSQPAHLAEVLSSLGG